MTTRSTILASLAFLFAAALAPAQEVRGVITKVDPDKKEIVVERRGLGVRGEVLTLQVGKDVQIMFGQAPGLLADVKVGRRVHVSVNLQDGVRVAVGVNVMGPKPAAAPMPRPVANDASTVSGVLRRVALTDREIVVATPGLDGKEAYTTLPVPEDAKITRDDKAIKFDDLKEEERVVVRTEMRNGKRVASAVMVGQVNVQAAAAPADETSKIARLRMILQTVDAILELAEKREKK